MAMHFALPHWTRTICGVNHGLRAKTKVPMTNDTAKLTCKRCIRLAKRTAVFYADTGSLVAITSAR